MISSCNWIVLLSLTQGSCPLIKSNLICYRKITNGESREERMESSGCSWVSQVRELLSRKVMQGILKDTHTHTNSPYEWGSIGIAAHRQHWCPANADSTEGKPVEKGQQRTEMFVPFLSHFPVSKDRRSSPLQKSRLLIARLHQPCWGKGKIEYWN